MWGTDVFAASGADGCSAISYTSLIDLEQCVAVPFTPRAFAARLALAA